MSVKIKFLGAAGSVTGSKYLVSYKDKKILIDAGMFQGGKELRKRNWHDPEVKLSEIDAVILTHGHIDHVGILPRYYALGLRCPVYCTKPTGDLLKILLPDAAYLQEEEAKYRNKKKKTSHTPALPLYTGADAKGALTLVKHINFSEENELFPEITVTPERAGHIIGASSLYLKLGEKTITFSGDIGRYDLPILVDPQPAKLGDLLLIESTYGNREHPEADPKAEIKRIINEAAKRKGSVIIPSFAVGRTQLLLYYIRELKEENAIPDLPVIIDSPMATDATEIYRDNPAEYDEDAEEIFSSGRSVFQCSKLALIREASASKKLNNIHDPMIIISASGMLYGGRILHHLKNRINKSQNTVLFVGYQPPGSRGDLILSGAKSIRLMGYETDIKAKIERISGLSAHGDQSEMLRWAKSCSGKPKKVMIIHGEPDSATAFGKVLKQDLGWGAEVAKYLQTIEI